jgi:site-specific DNA recombinase
MENELTKRKKAAIYIRLSSEEQAKEGYSPQTQKEKALEFIKSNGYEIDEKHIYIDLGYSGATDKRPAFQRLLEDARKREFDVIVVYRLDRLFRNLRLLVNTAHELRELGIGLISVTEPFDTSTPTGRASLHLLGTMAEWQREVNLEARNEGALKAVKEGKWVGSGLPPFGYDFDPKTQRLKINEDEARVVRMVFEWLVYDGLTVYQIQKRLNEMKIPTKFDRVGKKKKNGKGWWQPLTVWRMLKREIYTGTYYWRKYKKPNRSLNKEENLRPRKDWVLVKVPAIISRELFEKAQEKLSKNKMLSKRRTKNIYLFQHKLICGFDGRRYSSVFRRPDNPRHQGTIYYICPNKFRNQSPIKCKSHAIAESRLSVVWENLKSILSNPEKVFTHLKEYVEQRKGPDIREKINEIEKRIAFWKNKERRLAELYSEGIIDLEIYKKQWEECKKEESKLLEKRELLNQTLLDEEEREKRVTSLKELYQRLKDSLENASRQIKYEIIQRLVEKIVVKGNILEIEYNFPFLESLKVTNKNVKEHELSSFCFKHERVSYKNKTFKVFAKVELLSRSEISKSIWARRKELARVK